MSSHAPEVLALHNVYKGRCFVLGNGPSLLTQDLTPLAKEASFCCNGWPKWKDRPFDPTFYGVSDIQSTETMRSLLPYVKAMAPQTKKFNVQFLSRREVHDPEFLWVEKAEDNHQVQIEGLQGMDATLGAIPTGRTTPLTLVSLALWFGFRQIYFLGVEQTLGYMYDPSAMTTLQGQEMTRTQRYYLAIQRCFQFARAQLAAKGGSMADCTIGGFLTGGHVTDEAPARAVLPYVPLEELV